MSRWTQSSPVRLSSESMARSEEHTSELQSRSDLVCRLLLEKKKKTSETCARLTVTWGAQKSSTTGRGTGRKSTSMNYTHSQLSSAVCGLNHTPAHQQMPCPV